MQRQTISKFSIHQKVKKLKGGQEQSFQVGDLVLKPIYDENEYLWVAKILNTLNAKEINISKPVLSRYGNYVEDGFGATQFFENIGHPYNIDLALQLCRQLNQTLKHITEPPLLFKNLNNPWKKAHSIAWNENATLNLPNEILFLMSLRKPIHLPKQLIHSDLTGNILINKNGTTCIIDFTPAFFPKEYAEAIILVDYITWHNAPLKTIDKMVVPYPIALQFILRALLFRLCVPLFIVSENTIHKFNEELKHCQKLLTFFKNYNII